MRPQADALGQNLPSGAISSAVEHLPYKEIVTGSIPVSPIPPNLSSPLASLHDAGGMFADFYLGVLQTVLLLRCFKSLSSQWHSPVDWLRHEQPQRK